MVPTGTRALALIEAKASRTVTPGMAESLVRLGKAVRRYDVTKLVVHAGAEAGAASLTTLRPGVKAVSVDRLLPLLAPATGRRSTTRAR